MNAILDKVNVSDLPSAELKEVAQVIGISKLKELIIKCPGMKLYIPKSIKIVSNKRYVDEHFNGGNYKEIAEHLGITVRSVYRLRE